MWQQLERMNRVRPYVFKTRINRAIKKTKLYGKECKNDLLCKLCDQIEEKMLYISDQSNQTTDGQLRSFLVLKKDIHEILMTI